MSRYKSVAILLVLLHLLLATAYSIGNPLGEAPDETDHWAYVVYLARERSLPEGPRVTQSKHPPLYHATAAAVASLTTPRFDFLRANPDVAIQPDPTQSPNFFIHTTLEDWPWTEGALAFHLARLWSVLLSSATVAAIFGLARSSAPHPPRCRPLGDWSRGHPSRIRLHRWGGQQRQRRRPLWHIGLVGGLCHLPSARQLACGLVDATGIGLGTLVQS